jgi:hypothetical protein
MNSVATYPNVATEFISDIRTGMTYPNVATEFISNIRTGTTYPNVTPEFISDIRTGTTYLNVATEFYVVPVLISEMNSVANIRVSRSCSNIRDELSCYIKVSRSLSSSLILEQERLTLM